MSFSCALKLVRLLEGGKWDDPNAGPTNQGMTQETWIALGFTGSVDDATDEQIANAYQKLWNQPRFGFILRQQWPVFPSMPEPADAVGFQFFINVPPTVFVRALQGAIGAKMDGVLGPLSWAALSGWNGRGGDLSAKLLTIQEVHYRGLESPFEAGLLARVAKVRTWLEDQHG